jgi:thioredoxin reductase (NADPH)
MTPTFTGRQDEEPEYDLLIVGGGPSALAATFYARTHQIKTMMVYEDLGGKLGWRYRVAGVNAERTEFDRGQQRLGDVLARDLIDLEDEYIPGNEVVRLLLSRTVMQAGQVLHDRALQVAIHDARFEITTHKHGVLRSTAVLIATGASPVPLAVLGAHHLAGQRLLYSIPTYAHLVSGNQIAVIGTTQRALRGVLELARTAERVYFVTPESHTWTQPLMTALMQLPNVEVLAGYEVQEVLGAAAVEGIIVAHRGQARRLDIQHAFVDLGLTPNSELVRGIAALDPDGFIMVDAQNATNVPGLFAVGDVTTTFCEQVLVATGDGVRAAIHAYTYLLAQRVPPPIAGAV